ncbi:MAG: L7Ae/L30e/S12e/Gadd45 family ribosomal protein [Saccharofermentans sp.]|jgi:ribosomal protein L7Ae-like RNA K-turn-binding protein|nr:ribosomal L7Ae/L30e/S12e/Gadd45 family protein [Clostridiales bacterium]MCR5385072.1 L7Ae/L30e/S12e/Gadd45 family ribosomal protein [Saccharofermentans sp.]
MTDKDRAFGMIGLAARAGKVVSGSDAVNGAIRSNKVELLIITRDISRNSLEKILKNLTGDKEIPCYRFATSDELGNALGKPNRTVAAITDKSFAEGISAILDIINEEEDT